MSLKMIVNSENKKFYIDTKKIEAIKCIKFDYYYLVYIYTNYHKIELKFDNEDEFKEAFERLKG